MIKIEENLFEIENKDLLDILKERPIDSHKGMFGTVGIIGGSINYSGAIKKYQDSASNWWLRSSDSRYTNVFYNVTSNGIFDGPWISENASRTYGVAPAFRIG